jgi:dynein heavy chain
MTTLFVKITNQMIRNCKQCITAPGKLWTQQVDDLLERLDCSLRLNDSYQEQYRLTREKLMSQPKVKQFDFNEGQIFGKMDLFCKRVLLLNTKLKEWKIWYNHSLT